MVLLSALFGLQQQTKPLTESEAHRASVGIALSAGLSMCAYDHLYKKRPISKEVVTKSIEATILSWFIAHAYLRTKTDTWKQKQEAAALEANKKLLETIKQAIKDLDKQIPQASDILDSDILNHALRIHQQPWALKLAAENADILIQRVQAIQTQIATLKPINSKLASDLKQIENDGATCAQKCATHKNTIIKHPQYAQHVAAYQQHIAGRERQQTELRQRHALELAQEERRRQEALAQQARLSVAAAVAAERLRTEGQFRQEREQLTRQIVELNQRLGVAQQQGVQFHDLRQERAHMTEEITQLQTRMQELERQLAQRPAAAAQQCGICFDEGNNFVTLACTHAFCPDCLTGQLDVALRDQSTTGLLCATPACRAAFTQADIQQITRDPATLRRLTDIRYQEDMDRQGAKNCPTPNCTHRFVHNDNRVINTTCPRCRQTYCANCLLPHDIHISCQEAARRSAAAEDTASEAWKLANTRECTNRNCRARIERSQGCDHMTCSKCRNEFCFNCLGPFDHGSFCRRPRAPFGP